MKVRFDRIARIQEAMREQGWIAIVILNHDDYRHLFGTDRTQPRALIPFQGPPELIDFTGEEPELRSALPEGKVRVFGSVGANGLDCRGCARFLGHRHFRLGGNSAQSGEVLGVEVALLSAMRHDARGSQHSPPELFLRFRRGRAGSLAVAGGARGHLGKRREKSGGQFNAFLDLFVAEVLRAVDDRITNRPQRCNLISEQSSPITSGCKGAKVA